MDANYSAAANIPTAATKLQLAYLQQQSSLHSLQCTFYYVLYSTALGTVAAVAVAVALAVALLTVLVR